jgi:hypothetical protein
MAPKGRRVHLFRGLRRHFLPTGRGRLKSDPLNILQSYPPTPVDLTTITNISSAILSYGLQT